jgi:hypothetical protein
MIRGVEIRSDSEVRSTVWIRGRPHRRPQTRKITNVLYVPLERSPVLETVLWWVLTQLCVKRLTYAYVTPTIPIFRSPVPDTTLMEREQNEISNVTPTMKKQLFELRIL